MEKDLTEINLILLKFFPQEICELILNKIKFKCKICKKYFNYELNYNKCIKCEKFIYNLKYAENWKEMMF